MLPTIAQPIFFFNMSRYFQFTHCFLLTWYSLLPEVTDLIVRAPIKYTHSLQTRFPSRIATACDPSRGLIIIADK